MDIAFTNVPTYPLPVMKIGETYTFKYLFLNPTEVVFQGYEIKAGVHDLNPQKACIVAHLVVNGEDHFVDCWDIVPHMDIFKDGERVLYEMSESQFGLSSLKVHSRPLCNGIPTRIYMDDDGNTMQFQRILYKGE